MKLELNFFKRPELELELELTFRWSGISQFHYQFHQLKPPIIFCYVIQIYKIQCSQQFSNTSFV